MQIIGLTGGIGSGKSTVAELFVEQGAGLVDTDEVSRHLTGSGGAALQALQAAFGDPILAADGALDRAAMRERVFSDPRARAKLESILHPMIRRDCDAALSATARAGHPYCLLAVPLLFEGMSYRGIVSSTLLVDCPVSLQIARVTKRSGLAEAEVARIIAAQLPRALRLQLADQLVWNASDIAALHQPIAKLHARFTRG